MHWWDGWGGAHMMGMGLFWLFVLVALVVLVVWLLRSSGTARGALPSAEEMLRERYARGEIDAEEYRERLAELRRP
jgi:putative membrane protein